MYCVMRASVPSLYNVYRRYDIDVCIMQRATKHFTISLIPTCSSRTTFPAGHYNQNCTYNVTTVPTYNVQATSIATEMDAMADRLGLRIILWC